MKTGIHPNYRPVVFKDFSCDFAVLSRSTIKATETIEWEDGNTYPLVRLEISSGSHPFFTGKQKLLDSAGRVEKFNKKYARKTTK
jgi:large subunit ribosomal protein L31